MEPEPEELGDQAPEEDTNPEQGKSRYIYPPVIAIIWPNQKVGREQDRPRR
jgi:hypothetical protein